MKLGNPIRVAEGVYQIRAIGARVTALDDGKRRHAGGRRV